jgi:hypothetical protein
MPWFLSVTFRSFKALLVLAFGPVLFATGYIYGSHDPHAATDLLQLRAETLRKAEQALPQLADSSTAQQHQRLIAEAQDALAALRAVYLQEEELWSYYAALQESVALRTTYLAAQEAASSHLAEQAGELARVDALVDALRPRQQLREFQFTVPHTHPSQ